MSRLIGSSMSATTKPLPNSVNTVQPKIATAYQARAGLGQDSTVPMAGMTRASVMECDPLTHRNENEPADVCAQNRVLFHGRCAASPDSSHPNKRFQRARAEG